MTKPRPGFNAFGIYLMIGVIFFLTSCIDTKKAIYFNDLPQGELKSNTPLPENTIHAQDLLSIVISSSNSEAAGPFNIPNDVGYLVGKDSLIELPIIGTLKVAGLTKDELKFNIKKYLLDKKLLINPIVSIRFMNYRVTVLGEVGTPKVITVPDEKLNLLEAIAMSGDLTPYSRKDYVLIIREINGQKVSHRIDLNSQEIFNSPFYNLKSNDIIYVEPTTSKIKQDRSKVPQVLGLALSVITLAITVATFFKF
jgi:polysaccharide export outer membrane protein